ncbi:HAD-IIB family hydrolase [Dethiobacter alkaliphilus]|uniref:sucrose-phosphate synthase n=1 Tax=Dethiobacter alkaliphilus AHT 1 TaxID=555088 RepID=C0GGZ2_DETAL|nr:HAD-IIB family hydrolase [Dethiobacter alkaliphilus]EEG77294.1 sucrose-phosphate synthase [Dethiobacter alkaliphilus AHT 1]
MSDKQGLYIILVSVHGLIRGHNLELGRDADTGGQTLYVVELARALAEHPDVDRVDLVTRQVIDAKVDSCYAQWEEEIAPGAYIVRVPCGPRRYLRKEVLWPYLDSFADAVLQHVRRVGRVPDWVHGHYADAGYVGARLAGLLRVPLVFTGHSLGRVKRQRLLDSGMKAENIEAQFNISQRIEAEELALDSASLVVGSTNQEVEEQYRLYDNHVMDRMQVIPPGTNLEKFRPPRDDDGSPPIQAELERFLHNSDKPMILAVSRADERKNIATLIQAYGENKALQEAANLVVVAGNRDDITAMDRGARNVLTTMLLQVDKYDLYGKMAYPKHHKSEDVPDLYRMAAASGGVFVNPALTEPFGLTLIEAAASGLPVVATEDGGPRDIQKNCQNGFLIDPLDANAMGETILSAITDKKRWQQWSENGLRGARENYAWQSHVGAYLDKMSRLIYEKQGSAVLFDRSQLPVVDRILVSDIDNTLIGDEAGLEKLLARLKTAEVSVGFGIATGRRIESTLEVLEEWGVPVPDILITSVGSEIRYGPNLIEDKGWAKHINFRWKRAAIEEAMSTIPGLKLQSDVVQRRFKISYYYDPEKAPGIREIKRHLRKLDLHAKVIYSHGKYLDILPIRASKGLAIRYLSIKWGLPLEWFLVAGDSGNDEEMLTGNTLGVVVANHSEELEKLKGRSRVYFAKGEYANGILEGIDHYDFLGNIRNPEQELKEDTDGEFVFSAS